MSRHRRRRKGVSGGLGTLLLIAGAVIGAFFLIRSNPALASKLPPEARKFVDSVKVPTGIPEIQIPTGLPAVNLPGSSPIGSQTKTTDCQAANGLPDSACTPGAIFSDATTSQICAPGYSQNVRNVPESEKDQVYAEYGIATHSSGEYEVDHLISLELGGSNEISNLWPEAANPKPGFHEKDKVENYLHDQVCNGAISLIQAQQQIATNWLEVYNQMNQ
jgi:hypothetical protein